MTRYVALLRGINVGGKNLIGMGALKTFFEAEGFTDVVTYIQSGNVIFSSDERASALVGRIESQLSNAFAYTAHIVLRSKQQMHRVVREVPPGFGSRPELHRYDVIFLKERLSAAAVVKTLPTRPGVDQVFAGNGVLYFSRLIAKAPQSYLSRLASMPVYKKMTIRNWNTTVRLDELMQGRQLPG